MLTTSAADFKATSRSASLAASVTAGSVAALTTVGSTAIRLLRCASARSAPDKGLPPLSNAPWVSRACCWAVSTNNRATVAACLLAASVCLLKSANSELLMPSLSCKARSASAELPPAAPICATTSVVSGLTTAG